MMWIHATLILLLPEVWSQMPVIIHSASAFNLGSDANLTCSNKTWSEILHVIWIVTQRLEHSDCQIAFGGAVLDDSCQDGKTLQNTTSARPFLHIPNFSNSDVGTYRCETSYRGGIDKCEIQLSIIVPPALSSWLERRRDGKTVAVCKAEGGKPAARISWAHGSEGLNSTSEQTTRDSGGSVTVESRLDVLPGVDAEELRCAVSHPYWPEGQILTPKLEKGYVLIIIIIAAAISALLIGIVFFLQKKKLLRRCQQSNASPSESAPTEDVEEVEPYASYVQRVNSIYNSSADLLT